MIDITNAKKLHASDQFKAYRSDPLSLYKDCQTNRESVSAMLERLDPSERDSSGKIVSELNALERHLAAADIALSGPKQAKVEDLAAGDVSYLMPELVLRTIEEGRMVNERYSAEDCIAATVPHKGATYHPLYIPNLNTTAASASQRDKSLGRRAASGKGGAFPVLSVDRREKDVVVRDYGRTIECAYSVIRDYAWQDFAIILHLIGAQLASDDLQDIYDLGITGDGTVGAATNTFAGVAGTLAYTDLMTNYISFGSPFAMDRILAPVQSFTTILAMAQFQDPLAFNKVFQASGLPVTPFGAKLKEVDAVPGATPTGTVIVTLDSRYAVRKTVVAPLSVEAEKIINRKYESATVSEEKVFSIIADGALKRILWT